MEGSDTTRKACPPEVPCGAENHPTENQTENHPTESHHTEEVTHPRVPCGAENHPTENQTENHPIQLKAIIPRKFKSS